MSSSFLSSLPAAIHIGQSALVVVAGSRYGDSTAINYRTHIWKHLPFFGEYSMKDLNPEMAQQFVSASAVNAKTTKNICIALQSMWTTAKAWGYVAHDLMEGVVLPEVKRVQRFFLSQREI
jgi:hypothetical protein